MKLTKAELRDALITERKQLIELVESASDSQLQEQSLCEGWTNKNVLGHILGFELSSLDALLLMFRVRELDISMRSKQRNTEIYLKKTILSCSSVV